MADPETLQHLHGSTSWSSDYMEMRAKERRTLTLEEAEARKAEIRDRARKRAERARLREPWWFIATLLLLIVLAFVGLAGHS